MLWTGKANEQVFYFTVVWEKQETIRDIIINTMIFNILIICIHDNTWGKQGLNNKQKGVHDEQIAYKYLKLNLEDGPF